MRIRLFTSFMLLIFLVAAPLQSLEAGALSLLPAPEQAAHYPQLSRQIFEAGISGEKESSSHSFDLAARVQEISSRYDLRLDSDSVKNSETFVQMVQGLESRLQGHSGIAERIRVLNDYFFQELGFSYADQAAGEADNLWVSRVLESRQGQCLSLSVIYLSLAEKAGIPVKGVLVPGHFFVRYETPSGHVNIELTQGGIIRDDLSYVLEFGSTKNPNYFRPLEKHEVFAVYVSNMALTFQRSGREEEAIRLYREAVQLLPHFWNAQSALSNLLGRRGELEEAVSLSRSVIAENPSNGLAHRNLAIAGFMKGQFSQARYHALKAGEAGVRINLPDTGKAAFSHSLASV